MKVASARKNDRHKGLNAKKLNKDSTEIETIKKNLEADTESKLGTKVHLVTTQTEQEFMMRSGRLNDKSAVTHTDISSLAPPIKGTLNSKDGRGGHSDSFGEHMFSVQLN